MRTASILSAIMAVAVCASSLTGCSSEVAPLPEVRYFAIAET